MIISLPVTKRPDVHLFVVRTFEADEKLDETWQTKFQDSIKENPSIRNKHLQDLLIQMLTVDPKARPSMKALLNHKLFDEFNHVVEQQNGAADTTAVTDQPDAATEDNSNSVDVSEVAVDVATTSTASTTAATTSTSTVPEDPSSVDGKEVEVADKTKCTPTYTLQELQTDLADMQNQYDGKASTGVVIDVTRRETYLSVEEFQTVFGMSKDAFQALPKWKQKIEKQKNKLF